MTTCHTHDFKKQSQVQAQTTGSNKKLILSPKLQRLLERAQVEHITLARYVIKIRFLHVLKIYFTKLTILADRTRSA